MLSRLYNKVREVALLPSGIIRHRQEGDRQPGSEGYPGGRADLRRDDDTGGSAPGDQTADWRAAAR